MSEHITFKQIREEDVCGFKQVTKYVCNERPEIEIRLERGSMASDRVTGFALYINEVAISSYMTLKEAKECAEYHAQKSSSKTK